MTEQAWPLVTVIMPVRNGAATLAQAMDSVLWQGYAPIQILVVDDASEDATSEVLLSYGDKLEVLQAPGVGPAAARNLALDHAQADLVAFIDADDVWWPGKLHAQVRYMLEHPEVAVTFGRFQRWDVDGQSGPMGACTTLPNRSAYDAEAARWLTEAPPIPLTTTLTGCLYADLMMDSVVHIITAMVRRSAALSVGGFDATLARGSDYDFWLKLSRHCSMAQLDRVMASYRVHRHSLTKQPWAENGEYLVLTRAISLYGLVGPDGRGVCEGRMRQRLRDIAFGHGYLLFWCSEFSAARAWFAKALRARPLDGLRPGLYWLLTWLGPILSRWGKPGLRWIENNRSS